MAANHSSVTPHTEVTYGAARAHLVDLVAFDTTSHRSNLELIDHVEAFLTRAGAQTRRFANAEGTKANLLARFGPAVEGGVVLSGHTDVVPVEGQDWATDPWRIVEADGKLYGRGTCDMKGFIACVMAGADALAEAATERPVYVALSYDEEVGCYGAPAMIEGLIRDEPKPRAVIIGEPTELKVVSAHKGLRSFDVTITGREAHSSLVEDGACAVTHAAPILNYFVEAADALKAAAPADSPFSPPYGTITVGTFHGGEAKNILAGRARLGSLMRPAPWDDPDAIEAGLRARAAEVESVMRRTAPEARVEVVTSTNVPALRSENEGVAEALARRLTGDNAKRVVSFGTEAGQFQAAGLSTVVCGPGSIAQAHQPNEFITCAQLQAGADFIARLAQIMATETARP